MDRDRLLEERRSAGVLRDERPAPDREGIVGGSATRTDELLHLRDRRRGSVVPPEPHERLHEQLVRELVGIPDPRAPEQRVHVLDELDRSLAATERDLAEREVEHGMPTEPVETERGAAGDRQLCMLEAAVVQAEPRLETREGVDRVRPDDDLPELLGQRHGLRDGGVGGREAPAPGLGEPLELKQLREPGEVSRRPGAHDRVRRLLERPGVVIEPERRDDRGVLQA